MPINQRQSPEARVLYPRYTAEDYLRIIALGNSNLIVAPPRRQTANGMAFAKRAQGVITRTIQNVGIVPIYWKCSDTPPAMTTAYDAHGIIPPGSAPDDGFGAVLDVSRYNLPIYIWVTTGSLAALTFAALDWSANYDQPNADRAITTLIYGA